MEPNINNLKSYCLDLLLLDPLIKEEEDCKNYANKILKEWSKDKLKSYAVCESLDTLENQVLVERVVTPFSEQFDKNIELQKTVLTEGVGKSILGIIIFGLVPWGIWRVIKHEHDKHTQKCKTFGFGKKYDICMLDAKIKYQKGQIKVITKNMREKKCDIECKTKSRSAIEKLKLKIIKNEKKLTKLKSKV